MNSLLPSRLRQNVLVTGKVAEHISGDTHTFKVVGEGPERVEVVCISHNRDAQYQWYVAESIQGFEENTPWARAALDAGWLAQKWVRVNHVTGEIALVYYSSIFP